MHNLGMHCLHTHEQCTYNTHTIQCVNTHVGTPMHSAHTIHMYMHAHMQHTIHMYTHTQYTCTRMHTHVKYIYIYTHNTVNTHRTCTRMHTHTHTHTRAIHTQYRYTHIVQYTQYNMYTHEKIDNASKQQWGAWCPPVLLSIQIFRSIQMCQRIHEQLLKAIIIHLQVRH